MTDSVSTPVVHSIHYIRLPLRVRAVSAASSMLIAALVGGIIGSILSACIFPVR